MAASSIADASILYINQGITSEEDWGQMATKTTLEAGKTYTDRIGGENLSTVYEVDIEITSDGVPVQLGDANQSGTVEAFDIIAVLDHMADKTLLTGKNAFAADANVSGSIEAFDIISILDHLADMTLLGEAIYTAE